MQATHLAVANCILPEPWRQREKDLRIRLGEVHHSVGRIIKAQKEAREGLSNQLKPVGSPDGSHHLSSRTASETPALTQARRPWSILP